MAKPQGWQKAWGLLDVPTKINPDAPGSPTGPTWTGNFDKNHASPRRSVNSVGFANIVPGSRIFRSVLQDRNYVPGRELTGINGRWERLPDGRSAWTIDDAISSSNLYIVWEPGVGGTAQREALVDPRIDLQVGNTVYVDMNSLRRSHF